jgi:septum formation topological specificity factor MinE
MNPFRLVANNERPSVDRLRLRLETERRLMDDPAELSALQTQLLVVLDRVDRGLEELCRLAAEDEA